MTRFLLTGATGFLGREVLVRLLDRGDDVLVTTRRRQEETKDAATKRLTEIVSDTSPSTSTERMTVAFGDVTQPGFGLDDDARAWLDVDPVQIVHGAAEVRFDLPYEHMFEQNVKGTLEALALARSVKSLVRFDHVSTAYVAGDRTDVALESDIDVGQKPRNDYEKTKLLAEVEVEKARSDGLPITVHRPSIIVGDSRTGRASSFKVLYWPMKVYARGRFRTVFGRPDCTVDVVPVDYVADAMVSLFGDETATNKTFHLTAGPEGQATIAELAAMGQRIFEGKPIRYFDPDIYLRWIRPWLLPILRLVKPDVANRGGVFLPYLRSNPSFSTTEANAHLGELRPPDVRGYFETIMRYARDTDFGRIKELSPGRPPDS